MLNHPTGLFSEDYISALRGCWPLKFVHKLQLPKMYFKPYLGRRAASCWALPHISSLFFNQTQDLRAPSADRRETLHSDQDMRQLFNACPKFRGSSPKKFGRPKTCKIWTDFTQLPTFIANISGTRQDIKNRKDTWSRAIPPAFSQTSPVNFGPLSIK